MTASPDGVVVLELDQIALLLLAGHAPAGEEVDQDPLAPVGGQGAVAAAEGGAADLGRRFVLQRAGGHRHLGGVLAGGQHRDQQRRDAAHHDGADERDPAATPPPGPGRGRWRRPRAVAAAGHRTAAARSSSRLGDVRVRPAALRRAHRGSRRGTPADHRWHPAWCPVRTRPVPGRVPGSGSRRPLPGSTRRPGPATAERDRRPLPTVSVAAVLGRRASRDRGRHRLDRAPPPARPGRQERAQGMIPPPSHSHMIRGWMITPIVAGPPGVRRGASPA